LLALPDCVVGFGCLVNLLLLLLPLQACAEL
jgi:hypothetical protein